MEILQNRMRELQFALYERKIPLVLVFEGMDAAGKGGNIKRIREKLDPTGYQVHGIVHRLMLKRIITIYGDLQKKCQNQGM